jgi:hypothetical protein
MSIDRKYELAIAECHSLRRQLKDAYNKCTAIFEALSILDESSTNERILLEKLISDLKQTIQYELEKNTELSYEKLQYKEKEKYFKAKLNNQTEDLNKIMIKYQRIYINQQQENFIQDNLRLRMKK